MNALAQCAAWQENHPGLRVSVNLSARNPQQGDLPDQVRQALTKYGVPAELLELEITESFLMADPYGISRPLAADRVAAWLAGALD